MSKPSTEVCTFDCDQCSATYKQKYNLKIHRDAVHLKIKPYYKIRRFECDQCQEQFYRRRELKKHYDNVHFNTQRVQCHSCSAIFTTKNSLKIHIQKVHKEEIHPVSPGFPLEVEIQEEKEKIAGTCKKF